MSVERKTYSKEFKLEAVRRMETCETSQLWRRSWESDEVSVSLARSAANAGEEALGRRPGQPRREARPSVAVTKVKRAALNKHPGPLQKRIAELERRLGVKQLEVIFQAHLRACQGSDAESGRRWRQAVYQGIEASLSSKEKD